MVKLGELMVILDLHRQGLTVSAIACQVGMDCKTIRRYIARGLEPPTYGPRPPQQEEHRSVSGVSARAAFSLSRPHFRPAVAGTARAGLCRRVHAVKHTVCEIRPEPAKPFEVRFETPPGAQAQVDLAHFEVVFADVPQNAIQPPDAAALTLARTQP